MSIISSLFLFLSCISLASSTNDDEIALLKIKEQLGDPDGLSSWVKGFEFCNAPPGQLHSSVACDTLTGRVSFLSLNNLDVTAPFPDAICNLTSLYGLNLDQIPGLYGPIPSCITELSNLGNLFIEGTSLSGSVPSFFNHTNLRMIELRQNHLSGTIPESLSTLPKLVFLDLAENYLTGAIPPSLSNLPNLNHLVLSSNYLTGTIPSGLVHGSFAWLELSNNSLTGELPSCYGWVDLTLIDVANNQLSGDASFLFSNQKRKSIIVLANNEFEFDLSYIQIPQDLMFLDLSHNNIYGSISESFKGAFFISLDLSFNRLCGEIPQNLWKFKATAFANNSCLCGYPLPPCSTSAPASAPVLAASFDSTP